MTAHDDYPGREETFAAAEARAELAHDLYGVARLDVEGGAAWVYLVKTRKLPAAAVRAALPELRLVEPPIPGRAADDYGLMVLLRSADGDVVAFQLTFITCDGAASTRAPKRQTYNLVPGGVSRGLFHAGGGEGGRAHLVEGYGEKAIAVASLGIGPVYGAGSRAILGTAPPPESEVVLVTDRRPDDHVVVDPATGATGGALHDRDVKRAADLLLLAGKTVSVTPDPPACTHGCKDADDVLIKHGPIALEAWLEKAELVGDLSMDGEARRISKIADALERDVETTATAKRLKVRVGVLRERVRAHRDGEIEIDPDADLSGSAMAFEEIVPATEPQDGARLLDDIDIAIARHAFITEADRTKASLWVVHGHRRFLKNTTVLPRLIITAPGEDSGKSTFAVTLAHLGDTMIVWTDPTGATVFRAIEEHFCGLMLDELDAWWHKNEAIKSVLNSGFTKETACVPRMEESVERGRTVRKTRLFSTFAPIALIGIKLDTILPRTLVSRSLVIRMTPARVGEVPEEIFGNRLAVARLHTLAGRIKRWVGDHELALDAANPELPPGVINRLRLVWKPLIAIADQAGGVWPARARAALTADLGITRDPSLGELLLLDMRDVIRAHGIEAGGDWAIHTRDAIVHLHGIEDRTWSVFGRARDTIRDFEVSRLLAPYGLVPKQIQAGGRGAPNRRGYRLTDIDEAIGRYIRHPRSSAARPLDGTENPVDGAESLDFGLAATPLDAPLDAPLDETLETFRTRSSTGLASGLADASLAQTPGKQGFSGRSSGLAGSAVVSADMIPNGQDQVSTERCDPKVGDTVQWASGGIDQLPGGAVVTWVSDDGAFARVVGSMTGIPIDQLTVLTAGTAALRSCIDCGRAVAKPARGPYPKRCNECRAGRPAPVVEPGFVLS